MNRAMASVRALIRFGTVQRQMTEPPLPARHDVGFGDRLPWSRHGVGHSHGLRHRFRGLPLTGIRLAIGVAAWADPPRQAGRRPRCHSDRPRVDGHPRSRMPSAWRAQGASVIDLDAESMLRDTCFMHPQGGSWAVGRIAVVTGAAILARRPPVLQEPDRHTESTSATPSARTRRGAPLSPC